MKYTKFISNVLGLIVMRLRRPQLRSLKNYTVVLRPDDNGTFVAYVPAIAVCHAWGETIEEAQAELIQVFEMISEEYQAASEELPKDVEVAVSYA